jgi:hypothetical protein
MKFSTKETMQLRKDFYTNWMIIGGQILLTLMVSRQVQLMIGGGLLIAIFGRTSLQPTGVTQTY